MTVAFLVMAGVIAATQAFVLFREVSFVVVATVVLATGAWLAARASFRILELRVRRAVMAPTSNRPAMFTSLLPTGGIHDRDGPEAAWLI